MLNRRRGKTSTEGSNPSLSATACSGAPSESAVTFPRFHGDLVKPQRSSLRTQPGNRGRVWIDAAADYRIPRCTRRCSMWPCPACGTDNELRLQGAEEACDTGLVSTVPPPRQTAGHTVCREQFLVSRGSILAAPIRVVQHSGFRGAMADCQRLQRESTHQPSSQIEPAIRGPDSDDIPGPHLIRLGDRTHHLRPMLGLLLTKTSTATTKTPRRQAQQLKSSLFSEST